MEGNVNKHCLFYNNAYNIFLDLLGCQKMGNGDEIDMSTNLWYFYEGGRQIKQQIIQIQAKQFIGNLCALQTNQLSSVLKASLRVITQVSRI